MLIAAPLSRSINVSRGEDFSIFEDCKSIG
jgi:hypothetical protein